MILSETHSPDPALPKARVTAQDGKDCLYDLGPVPGSLKSHLEL